MFRSGNGARNFRNEQSILTNVSILFPVGNKVIVVLWKYWFTSLNCAQTTFFTAKQVKNVVIELK